MMIYIICTIIKKSRRENQITFCLLWKLQKGKNPSNWLGQHITNIDYDNDDDNDDDDDDDDEDDDGVYRQLVSLKK